MVLGALIPIMVLIHFHVINKYLVRSATAHDSVIAMGTYSTTCTIPASPDVARAAERAPVSSGVPSSFLKAVTQEPADRPALPSGAGLNRWRSLYAHLSPYACLSQARRLQGPRLCPSCPTEVGATRALWASSEPTALAAPGPGAPGPGFPLQTLRRHLGDTLRLLPSSSQEWNCRLASVTPSGFPAPWRCCAFSTGERVGWKKQFASFQTVQGPRDIQAALTHQPEHPFLPLIHSNSWCYLSTAGQNNSFSWIMRRIS